MDNPHLMLKVGCTKKLIKRLDDWDKQCASKEQMLRGWWPNGTQKDLAAKINELLSVVQGYKSGGALPDEKILKQLQRVLQVKLHGAYPHLVSRTC